MAQTDLSKLTDEQLQAIASGKARLKDIAAGKMASTPDLTKGPQPQAPGAYSGMGSMGMGALQGGTFGFADELSGIGHNVIPSLPTRDEARSEFAKAQHDNPISYGVGDVAGSVAPAIATGGSAGGAGLARAMIGLGAKGAGMGALRGAGDAPTMAEVPGAALHGAEIGGATGAAIPLAGAGLGAAANGLNTMQKVPQAMLNRVGKIAGGDLNTGRGIAAVGGFVPIPGAGFLHGALAADTGLGAGAGAFRGGSNLLQKGFYRGEPSLPAPPGSPMAAASRVEPTFSFGNAIADDLRTTLPDELPAGTFQGAGGRFQSGAIPLGPAGEPPPMSQYARGGWTPQAPNLSRRAGGQIRPEALGAKARNPLLQPQTPVVGMPPVNDPLPTPPAPPQFKQQLYGDQPGTPHYGSGGEVINAGYAHGGQVPSYLGAGFNSLGRVHGDTMGNVAHSPYATQTPPPNAGVSTPAARPSATPNPREPRDAVNPRVPTAYGGSLARGGQVPPLGAPHQDSVQIAATPNEFVVRQSAAQQIGDPGLNRLNQFDHLPPGVQQMIKQALRR